MQGYFENNCNELIIWKLNFEGFNRTQFARLS
jgi:hypothetical protein